MQFMVEPLNESELVKQKTTAYAVVFLFSRFKAVNKGT